MSLYSDLIIEASTIIRPSYPNKLIYGINVSKQVISKEQATFENKKPGIYYTLDTINSMQNKVSKTLLFSFKKIIQELSLKINRVLICGLGNNNYIVDSLGTKVCSKIRTKLNAVVTITPSVSGITGFNSIDSIRAITKSLNADLIIIIDSIATSSKLRLCNCYQLTTAGIKPGGGIDANNAFIGPSEIGTPLLVIGYPVILSTNNGFLTPYNIEDYIKKASDSISKAINKFLIHV